MALQCMAVCPRGHSGELELCFAAMSLAWHTLLLCALLINSQEQEVACMVQGRRLLVAAGLSPTTAAGAATLAALQSRLLAAQGTYADMVYDEEVSWRGLHPNCAMQRHVPGAGSTLLARAASEAGMRQLPALPHTHIHEHPPSACRRGTWRR
jgi:methylase of polypeptide subunit release factors